MSKFDQLYKQVLERFITPTYKKGGIPHSYEWIPETPKETPKENLKGEFNQYNWHGMPPEKWAGPPIKANIFFANNAGPFILTATWIKEYKKSKIPVKQAIDEFFNSFLNSENRTKNVEIKHAWGLNKTVNVVKLLNDIYLLFFIRGNNREVVWTDIFDDHDTYNNYLRYGRKE